MSANQKLSTNQPFYSTKNTKMFGAHQFFIYLCTMMERWWQRFGMLIVVGWLTGVCQAQTFSLVQKTDSLYLLTLTTDSMSHQWTLPYPVYRMETGDVDGNGTIEALVGVIKATRFYPEKDRRLFIFKNYQGLVRPMWLGSKLGGILQDFHYHEGRVRSLETNARGEYTVAEYRWGGFGPKFERYLVRNTDETSARAIFEGEVKEVREVKEVKEDI